MAYICFCKDHPDSAELRRTHTKQHLTYIESILQHVLVAGPLIREEFGEFNASFFVYDTDVEAEALKLLHNDPYYKAGIYAEVRCQRFRPAAGTWIGGTTW